MSDLKVCASRNRKSGKSSNTAFSSFSKCWLHLFCHEATAKFSMFYSILSTSQSIDSTPLYFLWKCPSKLLSQISLQAPQGRSFLFSEIQWTTQSSAKCQALQQIFSGTPSTLTWLCRIPCSFSRIFWLRHRNYLAPLGCFIPSCSGSKERYWRFHHQIEDSFLRV